MTPWKGWTDRVTVEWVEREGTWYAAAITGGPMPLIREVPEESGTSGEQAK